ncbi:UNVERIFIED_CONTAM: hypothetical protein RMT77_019554 [Armadillidium vulgare]
MSFESVDFEVFGKVQGCNFTKYAKDLAEQNGISGWIKNSRTGSITGRIQGTKESIDHMLKWLSEEGSPGCQIEKCATTNRQAILKPDYPKFSLKF